MQNNIVIFLLCIAFAVWWWYIAEYTKEEKLVCPETQHIWQWKCVDNTRDCDYYKWWIWVQKWDGTDFGHCMKRKRKNPLQSKQKSL